MNITKKTKTVLITCVCLVILGGCSFFAATPVGKGILNTYSNTLKKVDDKTKYETKKVVEDTCRASISSYKADKLTYEQYKNSDSELEKSWSESAKMRANKTAIIFNEYMLKNSHVFENNIPSDIDIELEILK